jgi:ubiquinone/menaquinone biosynthesis C-methylase UbiE
MLEATVQQQYDRLAEVYDRHWSHYIHKTLAFLHEWAEIPAHASVLDLACGTGEFERLLLQQNPAQQIVGIDISEQMLLIARQKFGAHPAVYSFHSLGRSSNASCER